MSNADEIAVIIEQEVALVLPHFDETVAFAIGSLLRERGLTEELRPRRGRPDMGPAALLCGDSGLGRLQPAGRAARSTSSGCI